jgi:hypothetical protein
MAILITGDINNRVNPAFNNNILTFKSDSVTDADYAEVTIIISGINYVFKIYPDENNNFWFNFKEALSTLINENHFADTNTYPTPGTLYKDAFNFISFDVEYKVWLTNGTPDSLTRRYEFLRAVYQQSEKELISARGDSFPLHKVNVQKYSSNEKGMNEPPIGTSSDYLVWLTYFKGYPFSIGLLGANFNLSIDSYLSEPAYLAANLAAMNVNPQSVTFTNSRAAYRLIISDGETQWSKIFDKFHAINFGDFLININVVDKCGVYLKWANDQGAFDYWLFEKNYIDKKDTDELGMVNNDYENIEDTISRMLSLGKQSGNSIELFANGVYSQEIDRVLAILDSPKVYLYTGEKDEAESPDKWMEVSVEGGGEISSRKNRYNISIQMNIPKITMK